MDSLKIVLVGSNVQMLGDLEEQVCRGLDIPTLNETINQPSPRWKIHTLLVRVGRVVLEIDAGDALLHPLFFLEVIEFAYRYRFGIKVDIEVRQIKNLFTLAYALKYGGHSIPYQIIALSVEHALNTIFPKDVFIHNTPNVNE